MPTHPFLFLSFPFSLASARTAPLFVSLPSPPLFAVGYVAAASPESASSMALPSLSFASSRHAYLIALPVLLLSLFLLSLFLLHSLGSNYSPLFLCLFSSFHSAFRVAFFLYP